MANISLARKYRPSTFSDLIGQEASTKILTNAIALHRVPQCIVFSGIRGVGKTTLARLYAKAINCENATDPNVSIPCDRCESCVAVKEGYHEDVLEIDGASHTGVDDIRQVQQSIQYVPQRSRYKVYIIDEVHMLSQSAFNALLKTLEEPPPHVIFLFATTELGKIPATILSRCQVFQLKKLTVSMIYERMKVILANENIAFDEDALFVVAKHGKGSMRDALTMLDQAISMGNGKIDLSSIENLTVSLPPDIFLSFLQAMLGRSAADLISLVSLCEQKGVKWVSVVEELCQFARHAFILRDVGQEALHGELAGVRDSEVVELKKLVQGAPLLELNRIFRTLVKCREELDGSNIDRFIVENYLLEWCLDPGLPQTATAPAPKPQTAQPKPKEPIKTLSLNYKQAPQQPVVQEPVKQPVPQQQPAPIATVESAPEPAPEPTPAIAETRALPDSWREMVDSWKTKKPLQARVLEEASLIEYSPAKITLEVDPNSMAASRLLTEEVRRKILAQFQDLFGFTGEFKIVPRASSAEGGNAAAPSLLEIKAQEKEEAREKIREKAASHILTQEAVKIFQGKVGTIDVGL
jgi:DNA polymerase-3 subunit gamma/tau